MNAEPENSSRKIAHASCPEDLFGQPEGSPAEQLEEIHRIYRGLAKRVSPDVNGSSRRAAETFRRLKELYDQAVAAIRAGTYEDVVGFTLNTQHHRYEVGEAIAPSGAANCYRCVIDGTAHGVFAIAQTPSDNDLLQSEAQTLRLLHQPNRLEAKGYAPMLPRIIESFRYAEGGTERHANVFEAADGYVSIRQIRTAYPAGVHPKDMAWIWRRLLDILGYAHSCGVIHGAVLPTHVLVGTGDVHEVVLTNWQAAVQLGNGRTAHIPLIDLDYPNWYPPEVAAKQEPQPGTDILMSARCMAALLGGDPVSGKLPKEVPSRINGFLQSCLLLSQSQRPQNAWRLREEFTEMIENLWGKREYRPLTMPK